MNLLVLGLFVQLVNMLVKSSLNINASMQRVLYKNQTDLKELEVLVFIIVGKYVFLYKTRMIFLSIVERMLLKDTEHRIQMYNLSKDIFCDNKTTATNQDLH